MLVSPNIYASILLQLMKSSYSDPYSAEKVEYEDDSAFSECTFFEQDLSPNQSNKLDIDEINGKTENLKIHMSNIDSTPSHQFKWLYEEMSIDYIRSQINKLNVDGNNDETETLQIQFDNLNSSQSRLFELPDDDILIEINEISKLENNWDRIGCEAISRKSIEKGIVLLFHMYDVLDKLNKSLDTIWVCPTIKSGIKYEITYKNKEIGLWIEPPNEILKIIQIDVVNYEKKYEFKEIEFNEFDTIISWLLSN